jgi:hypothetical protein
MSTSKVKYSQLRLFLDDPHKIGSNPKFNGTRIQQCYRVMMTRLGAIKSEHETPIQDKFINAVKDIRNKYCDSVYEMPYNDPRTGREMTQFQFKYMYANYDKVSELMEKASKERYDSVMALAESEVTIEAEICPASELPSFQDMPLDAQKVYEGIILAKKEDKPTGEDFAKKIINGVESTAETLKKSIEEVESKASVEVANIESKVKEVAKSIDSGISGELNKIGEEFNKIGEELKKL